MKNLHLTILAIMLCSCCAHNESPKQSIVTKPSNPISAELSEKHNFLMDVVDESDFWYDCDSTRFSMYEENTMEWCDAVIEQYHEMYDIDFDY